MTASNDPLARIQAMVSAWGETEPFDTFDTDASEVSPPNHLENCAFGHFRHFRHQGWEDISSRDQSAQAYRQKAHEQESASRVVSYSSGVESVESVEETRKSRNDSDLVFDTSSVQVSKNEGRVSKTGREAALKPPTGICARVPVEWNDGVASLADLPSPPRFPAAKWGQLVTDAAAFLNEWGTAAHRLGWQAWELFGCHRRAPWYRLEGRGLVPALQGNKIAALTATEALIVKQNGARLTFRRRTRDPLHLSERALLWELGSAP